MPSRSSAAAVGDARIVGQGTVGERQGSALATTTESSDAATAASARGRPITSQGTIGERRGAAVENTAAAGDVLSARVELVNVRVPWLLIPPMPLRSCCQSGNNWW